MRNTRTHTGNQACQITSGTDYAVNEFDVWNYSWIKWVFLAVVVCYWFIWNTLAFLALCYVRYVLAPPWSPPHQAALTSHFS